MKYTIVIPTYNGDHYLERAILSAINQKLSADEILVYDDNSTDTTRVICERYASKVRYFFNYEGPSGFVEGWNNAIKQSKGDYICILHQDDLLYPTYLEEADKALILNPSVRHLFAICDYIDEFDKIISTLKGSDFNNSDSNVKKYLGKEYVAAYQKTYNDMPHIHRCPGVITHRSIFFEEGCTYNEAAGHIADDDFFYRVGQFTDVIGLLQPLAAYRLHPESETGSIGDVKLVERLAKDYLFQVRQWENSSYIDNLYFKELAVKFLTRLFMYVYNTKDVSLFNEAKSIYKELKKQDLDKVATFAKIKLEVAKIINIV